MKIRNVFFLSWLHCFSFAALDSFLPPSIWFWHKTVRKSTIDFTVSCQEKHGFCLWTIRKIIVFFKLWTIRKSIGFDSEPSGKAMVLTLNHLEKHWFWLWFIRKSTDFDSELSGKALVLILNHLEKHWFWLWTIRKITGFDSDPSGKAPGLTLNHQEMH